MEVAKDVSHQPNPTSEAFRPILQWMDRLILVGLFLLPLKLSLTYGALIPGISIWLIEKRWRCLSAATRHIYSPFAAFLFSAAVCSLFGRAPFGSFIGLFKLGFSSLTLCAVADVAARRSSLHVLLPLIVAQAIAGAHSLLEYRSQGELGRLFVGTLSESGQLSLTVVLALGLVFARRRLSPKRDAFLGLTALTLFVLSAFGKSFALSTEISTTALISGFLLLGWNTVSLWKVNAEDARVRGWIATLIPILIVALLVNLKRGPWIGVGVGSMILLFFVRRRFVLPLGLAALLAVTVLQPVRNRLFAAGEHFFITGGRSSLWTVGYSLAERYPLGIGYDNAKLVREYDDDIPPVHEHFHNTYLNILVEAGWISLGIFLWWIARLLALSFRYRSSSTDPLLAVAIGCSILSWLFAGTVEYNFGDSEVQLVFFAVMGVLAALYPSGDKASVKLP